jgi:hypothetical protein
MWTSWSLHIYALTVDCRASTYIMYHYFNAVDVFYILY